MNETKTQKSAVKTSANSEKTAVTKPTPPAMPDRQGVGRVLTVTNEANKIVQSETSPTIGATPKETQTVTPKDITAEALKESTPSVGRTVESRSAMRHNGFIPKEERAQRAARAVLASEQNSDRAERNRTVINEKTVGTASAKKETIPHTPRAGEEKIIRAATEYEKAKTVAGTEKINMSGETAVKTNTTQVKEAAGKVLEITEKVVETAKEAVKTTGDVASGIGAIATAPVRAAQTVGKIIDPKQVANVAVSNGDKDIDEAFSDKVKNEELIAARNAEKNISNSAKKAYTETKQKVQAGIKSHVMSGVKTATQSGVKTATKTVETAEKVVEKSGKAAVKTGKGIVKGGGRLAKLATNATAKISQATARATSKIAQTGAKIAAKSSIKAVQLAAKMAAKIAEVMVRIGATIAKAAVHVATTVAKAVTALVAHIASALIAFIAAGGWVIILVVILIGGIIALFGWLFPPAEANDTFVASDVMYELIEEYSNGISDKTSAIMQEVRSGDTDTEIQYTEKLIINGREQQMYDELGGVNNASDILAVYAARAMSASNAGIEVDKEQLLRDTFHEMVSAEVNKGNIEEKYKETTVEVPVLGEDGLPIYEYDFTTGTVKPVTQTVTQNTLAGKDVEILVTTKALSWEEAADEYGLTEQERADAKMFAEDEGAAELLSYFVGITDDAGAGAANGEPIKINPNMPTSEIGQTIVQNAMRYLGRSYDSMDCSCLTRTAYRDSGINWSGVAAEQARQCIKMDCVVSRSQLQPGDLVFWKSQVHGAYCGNRTCDTTKPCQRYKMVHHVAIYIGDGKIIESSGNGVHISNTIWETGKWKVLFFARPYAVGREDEATEPASDMAA